MYANVNTIAASLVHHNVTSTLCERTCCLRFSIPFGLLSLSVPASPSAMFDQIELNLENIHAKKVINYRNCTQNVD